MPAFEDSTGGMNIAGGHRCGDIFFEVEPVDGGAPLKLVRGPVQFNLEPTESTRAPQLFEHTETFLMELGLEWSQIEHLKSQGAIS